MTSTWIRVKRSGSVTPSLEAVVELEQREDRAADRRLRRVVADEAGEAREVDVLRPCRRRRSPSATALARK